MSRLDAISNNSHYIWFQQAFNDKVVIAHCLMQYWQIFSSFLIFCYYFTHLKALEISCKIWEARKIFLILRLAVTPCDNYISVQRPKRKIFVAYEKFIIGCLSLFELSLFWYLSGNINIPYAKLTMGNLQAYALVSDRWFTT